LDIRPGVATLGGELKRPPAPGAVSSPQIPGKVPDRSMVPGHGRLPVPKPVQVVHPLTEYGTAQRIMGVFELAPGEEDTKARWEQETAAYEELRKGDPSLLPPIRPARSFTGLIEALAGKAVIAEEELLPLPAESAALADAPNGEIAPATISPAEAIAAPVTPTAAADIGAPADSITVPTEPNQGGQTAEAPPVSGPSGATPAANPRLARIPQTGWVPGDGSAICPPAYPIKGNASSQIYHVPGSHSYQATIPELCFASVEAATAAGFRPPRR
jgi:hypothetical protein